MSDEAIRVMTDDHGFRVIAANVTESAREVLRRQRASATVAPPLAGLVAAAVLLRETMAPDLRVQGLMRGATGKGTLVGDSFPDGSVRGLAQRADSFALGPGSVLQMMRHMVNGGLQQGIVDVGAAGGIGEALTAYFHESEQLVCMARVGTLFHEGELRACGGFVVQLLPEAERPAHLIMTQRLEDFPDIHELLGKEGFSAQQLIDELVFGMPFTELARSPLRFGCRCDETTVLSALASLSKADIQSLIDDGEGLEIDCDYCGAHYDIALERLRGMLASS